MELLSTGYGLRRYHLWRALADSGQRVGHDDELDLWLVHRHADVRQAFADPVSFPSERTLSPVRPMCPAAKAVTNDSGVPLTTAATDGANHRRLRSALRAVLNGTGPQMKRSYEPVVRRRVTQLVQRVAARAGNIVDLTTAFTGPLPLMVIGDIIGVPEHDLARIKAWSSGMVDLVWGDPTPKQQLHHALQLAEFWHYCRDLTARTADSAIGNDTLITRALRWQHTHHGSLTADEVASLVFNLLIAGHESTSVLLAHAIDQALSSPPSWRMLGDGRLHPGDYLEEVMRYRPPIDGWLRVTGEEVRLGDATIPADARCLLLIGAANRDTARFHDPDAFQLHRPSINDHLAFGFGPHYCVGAGLARLEARIALEQLATAIPDLRLADQHRRVYRPSVAIRAHQRLLVAVGRAELPPRSTSGARRTRQWRP